MRTGCLCGDEGAYLVRDPWRPAGEGLHDVA